MKIRIRGNTIRLRLTQTELQIFEETGLVSEEIAFGLKPNECLTYALKRANCEALTASFSANQIQVLVPEKLAAQWIQPQEVGIENKLCFENGTFISILVEKDFKCLNVREGEEDSDAFPNPNQLDPKN